MSKDMTIADPCPVFDVDQAAQLLRCKPDTVRAACRTGDLPGLKWGEDWTIPAAALARRLEEKALAEATKRRAPDKPAAVTAVVHQIKGKGSKKLPVLPVLHGALAKGGTPC